MKNNDNRLTNIELLCPNHHANRHNKKRRKVVGRDWITGEKKTRLVKKSKKKKTKHRTRKTDIFGLPVVKLPKPPKFKL